MTNSQTASAPAATGIERDPGSAARLPVVTPPADIFETPDSVVVYLDMPSAVRDTVEVTLDDDVLNIVARSQHDVPTGYSLARAEYGDVAFERSFALGESIDGERIDAEMKDGVLKLVLPKTARSRTRRVPIAGA